MAGTRATASQAWAILKRHARDEIEPLRLQELCKDNERVSSLVSVHNANANRMVVIDLSRQRMTLETLNHLLRLASARGIRGSIKRLAWGDNDPDNPVRLRNRDRTRRNSSNEQSTEKPKAQMSYYLSLRAPEGSRMLNSEGGNALRKIHYEWDRIKQVSESIRRGQHHGITGSMIKDVIVVGRGVPIMALRFVYMALCKDQTAAIVRKAGLNDINNRLRLGGGGTRRIKFLTSVDPVRAAAVIGDLDPSSTMVISIAMNGNEETMVATSTLKAWLLQGMEKNGNGAAVIAKHMMIVTANRKINTELKRDNVFVLPDGAACEPFSTFTAATLLPLAIVFGWQLTRQFVDGAHTMDNHFVETNPRHNLPVLLALTDVWNDLLLSSNGRIISPFAEALAAYPAFCANLEAQTCGSASNSQRVSQLVIDGGLNHSYDKALYSANKIFPSELIMALDSQTSFNASSKDEDVHAAQDLLICSVFAHADELAFGSVETGIMSLLEPNPEPKEAACSDGNRPSALIICDRCDAFACGQLVALAEHRAVIKAWICDSDPFSKVEGSSIRVNRTESLKQRLDGMFAKLSRGEELDEDDEESDDGKSFNLSTTTILRHYANMMKDERVYPVT
ncbi:unnamed protein product [Cylindrotheca closterium]|uniref:Glucose-6-phosphate isomerase n=1 Tax=Cylindrotheca closterium TaxID=2856 RepID=A0AAD2FW24_9STRA|nr:unnamed protein product [Cylindrotheca closterium]